MRSAIEREMLISDNSMRVEKVSSPGVAALFVSCMEGLHSSTHRILFYPSWPQCAPPSYFFSPFTPIPPSNSTTPAFDFSM